MKNGNTVQIIKALANLYKESSISVSTDMVDILLIKLASFCFSVTRDKFETKDPGNKKCIDY